LRFSAAAVVGVVEADSFLPQATTVAAAVVVAEVIP
jgi:hypothetical protein